MTNLCSVICSTSVLALLCAGCGKSIPPDPHLQIIACQRPDEIDATLLDAFEITIDGVDPRTEVPAVVFGGKAHLVGRMTPKVGATQPHDSLDPVVGYRRISDGGADWTVPPCKMEARCEWNLSCSQRGTPVVEIDSTKDVNAVLGFQPGDYELRFFAILRNNATDAVPVVYHIGRGRMTVLPAAAESAEGE